MGESPGDYYNYANFELTFQLEISKNKDLFPPLKFMELLNFITGLLGTFTQG